MEDKEREQLSRSAARARSLFWLTFTISAIGFLIWYVRHPFGPEPLVEICNGIRGLFTDIFWITDLADWNNPIKVGIYNFCQSVKDLPVYDFFIEYRALLGIGLLGGLTAWRWSIRSKLSRLREANSIDNAVSGMAPEKAAEIDDALAQMRARCVDDLTLFQGDGGIRVRREGAIRPSLGLKKEEIVRWDEFGRMAIPLGDGTVADLELVDGVAWIVYPDGDEPEEMEVNVPFLFSRGENGTPRVIFTWLGGY